MKAIELRKMLNGYIVCKDGVVMSKRFKRPLKQDKSTEYCRITLCNNGIKKQISVHRLLAHLYIPNPERKPCVNHINGIKHDNRVENLEWCTYAENERHSHDVLGKKIVHSQETKNKIGSANKGRRMSEEQKQLISQRMKGITPWNKGIKQKDYVKK